MSILHIVGYKASKSLLSCSIPKLYPVVLSISGDIFNVKIYANCGLIIMEILTLKPSSNLSFMYFYIMEDLPTDWSPSRISLYLVLPPPIVLEETLIAFYRLLFLINLDVCIYK